MGATGNVTGAHTHFEIRDDESHIFSGADYLGLPNVQGSYNYSNLPDALFIDAPQFNGTVQGSTTVAGWATHPSGISRLDIYIEGEASPRATAYPIIDRSDVADNLKNSEGLRSGYSAAIKLDGVCIGNHHINVAAIHGDGSVQ